MSPLCYQSNGSNRPCLRAPAGNTLITGIGVTKRGSRGPASSSLLIVLECRETRGSRAARSSSRRLGGQWQREMEEQFFQRSESHATPTGLLFRDTGLAALRGETLSAMPSIVAGRERHSTRS